ncbi:MAG: hypothetical protein FWH40_10315, partial [Coriobacteriia bacterium]|nr:hypothetical protein [Coriobacteriia bacterium]
MKSSKKAIRLTLTATLVLMLLPLSSLTFAQETCNHIHDGSCSYVEGVACAHIHDESCGEAGELCTHVHDESCGYVEAVPCDHVCDESCFGESATEAEVDEIEAAEPEEPEEPEWGEDPGFELPEQSLVFRLAYGQSPILVGEDFTVVVRELDEDAYIVLPDSFVFDEEVNIDSPDAPNANRLAYTDENDIRRVHLAADEVGAELQVLLQAEEAGSFYLSLLDEVTNSLVSELLVIQVYDELPEAEEEIALMPLAADADYTVTFMTWSTGNNENDPTSFTSVFNSQIVTAGSTCVNPGSPTVMPPKGTGAEAYERIFVGWYAVGDDEQFDFAAPIESDLTVNARFGPQWQTPEQVNDLAELKAALVLAPIGVPTTIELTANITFYNEDNEITIPINRVIKLTSA